MKTAGTFDYWLKQIKKEHARAISKFPPFASRHEGYAIIKEELDELWDSIRANHVQKFEDDHVATEALQTATMAFRFLIDLCAPISTEGSEPKQ